MAVIRLAYESARAVSPAALPTPTSSPSRTTRLFHLARAPLRSSKARSPMPGEQQQQQALSPASATALAFDGSQVASALKRLEHEYGIWCECADVLVELGAGTKDKEIERECTVRHVYPTGDCILCMPPPRSFLPRATQVPTSCLITMYCTVALRSLGLRLPTHRLFSLSATSSHSDRTTTSGRVKEPLASRHYAFS